jgi:AAA15 family ATPase/GTPase
MLIEFRVRNFRSFRDENTLSLVASSDKTLKESNVTEAGILALPGVLRTVAIYGANASGKSNLIRAIALMRAIVLGSASHQLGQLFNVQSFMLDPSFENEPSEFEVTFMHHGVRFQFGFSLTPDRITSEWLIVYKTSKPQSWYSRSYNHNSGQEEYKFGSHFQGQRQLWRASTRPNALFLSTAIQLNSEQLKPIFDWFANGLGIFEAGGIPIIGGVFPLQLTLDKIKTGDSTGNVVTEFLLAADTGISRIDLAKEKGIERAIRYDAATGKFDHTQEEKEMLVPKFFHSSPKGSTLLNLADESEGTQRLFLLAGPLFEMLRSGCVLFVDELDRSLHTHLVRHLVGMFQNSRLNATGAQLIFTTHDTSLLSADLLRRDQIWFVEKNEDQASKIYPLTEFAPRKNEALERGYLFGRYGAVPIVKQLTNAPDGKES